MGNIKYPAYEKVSLQEEGDRLFVSMYMEGEVLVCSPLPSHTRAA